MQRPNVNPVQPGISTEELIAGLTRYIQSNKALPQFFDDYRDNAIKHAESLQQLQDAVLQGDQNASCFQERFCAERLLYLIQTKRIPYWQGITAYVFSMAVSQFSIPYRLKIPDRVKFHIEIPYGVFSWVNKEGCLTAAWNDYVEMLQANLKVLEIDIDIGRLNKIVLALPKSEQCYIKARFERGSQNHVHAMMSTMRTNVAIFMNKEEGVFIMPSLTLFNSIMAEISSDAMCIMPCFGILHSDTVNALHERNIHPGALYSKFVTHNTIKPHLFDCGGFLSFAHDMGHVYMASLLRLAERQAIFTTALPWLQKHLQSSPATYTGLKRTLGDFDLTPIQDYNVASTRFNTYLDVCINVDDVTQEDKLVLYAKIEKALSVSPLLKR